MDRSLLLLIVLTAASLGFAEEPAPVPAAPEKASELTELTIEQLVNLKVTSVQKRPESLRETAAAISVITSDEIVASGATTVPALLRRAPGVHVAQLNSSQWALGIRGFTNSIARSQLAVMDGRSLYTPLFAGTYWDVQNPFLEDVDRIEVVRGPGGTLWGANAVNGIVNIITKSASDTQGGVVVLGGGNQERGFGRARYGGRLGSNNAYRVYGSYFSRVAEYHADGDDYDDWHMYQGGFRTDWRDTLAGTLTVQGDIYSARAGRRTTFATFTFPYVQTLEQDADLSGGNLRVHWSRPLDEGRELTIQTYYDRTNRHEPNFAEDRDTVDFDGQYRMRLAGRHELVFGIGYRLSDGRTTAVPTIAFVPPDQTDDLFSAFAEDTVAAGRFRLTVGTKVERNDYSDFEIQPSGRLLFNASPSHAFWAAVTRPVRTPTRLDRDLVLNAALTPGTPVFVRLLGDSSFETERSLVYEAGYRGQFSSFLSADIAAFYNSYPNLESFEPGAPFPEDGRLIVPLRAANGTEGHVSGVEVGSDVRPLEGWLLRAAYSYLDMQLNAKPDSNDAGSSAAEGSSPRHQVYVSSTARVSGRVTLNALYRWVAKLPTQQVPAYSELDVRVGWRTLAHVELALAGQNLLHARHVEFGTGSASGGVQIRRSIYADASFRW